MEAKLTGALLQGKDGTKQVLGFGFQVSDFKTFLEPETCHLKPNLTLYIPPLPRYPKPHNGKATYT